MEKRDCDLSRLRPLRQDRWGWDLYLNGTESSWGVSSRVAKKTQTGKHLQWEKIVSISMGREKRSDPTGEMPSVQNLIYSSSPVSHCGGFFLPKSDFLCPNYSWKIHGIHLRRFREKPKKLLAAGYWDICERRYQKTHWRVWHGCRAWYSWSTPGIVEWWSTMGDETASHSVPRVQWGWRKEGPGSRVPSKYEKRQRTHFQPFHLRKKKAKLQTNPERKAKSKNFEHWGTSVVIIVNQTERDIIEQTRNPPE